MARGDKINLQLLFFLSRRQGCLAALFEAVAIGTRAEVLELRGHEHSNFLYVGSALDGQLFVHSLTFLRIAKKLCEFLREGYEIHIGYCSPSGQQLTHESFCALPVAMSILAVACRAEACTKLGRRAVWKHQKIILQVTESTKQKWNCMSTCKWHKSHKCAISMHASIEHQGDKHPLRDSNPQSSD